MSQIFFLLFQLFICVGYAFIMGSLLYSNYKGAPWVRTPKENLDKLISTIDIPRGSHIVELGCGTGGVLRALCKDRSATGVGVDINPMLVWIARFIAKIHHQDNVVFVTGNIYDYSLKKANFIYLFLMPKMLEKLVPKLRKELRPGATVISLGFKILGLKDKTSKQIQGRPYSFYMYTIV